MSTTNFDICIEGTTPVVQQNGLNTNKAIDFSNAPTCALPAGTTIGGSAVVALGDITSSSTTANLLTITDTGVYTGTGTFLITANSATTGVGQLITMNGLTTGTALSLVSTGTIVTTGEMLNIAANTATTSTGIVRVSATGLTDGWAAQITTGGANLTATGGGIDLVMGANTAGTGLRIVGTGVYTGTTGFLAITADSATTGSLIVVSGNGLTTGTGMSIVSTGTMTTTGNLLTLTANSATTAAGILRVNANALTSGIGVVITSSATAITGAGRLLRVDHTGATGTSAILSEFASAATDETTVLRVTASGALAAGVLLDLTGAAVTTGTLLDIGDADALTTGGIANFVSNSSSNGTRTLLNVKNDNTAATGTTIATFTQDAPTSTNFFKVLALNTNNFWVGNGTTSPNTALTGTAGDIAINCDSNKAYYCTGTTNWTALA